MRKNIMLVIPKKTCHLLHPNGICHAKLDMMYATLEGPSMCQTILDLIFVILKGSSHLSCHIGPDDCYNTWDLVFVIAY